MRILFAPDSFKGSLSAIEICRIMERAVNQELSCETISVPVADGGEGTVDALVLACNGRKGTCTVTGPLWNHVEAEYGLINNGRTAVIEMAQASGLPLVPEAKRDPLKTTSRGTGEVIKHVLDLGVRDVLVGIGGCATNDGGMGTLEALGVVFYNGAGQAIKGCGENLQHVNRVDLSGLDQRLKETSISVICDVTNPLLGFQGATYIYGPQKGAAGKCLEDLESGMEHYAQVFSQMGIDVSDFRGAGAAGGLGGVLKGVLHAKLLKGVDAVLEAVHFDDLLAHADVVFTGEGCLDGQSIRFGKVPTSVAERCAQNGTPVIAFVGGMGEDAMRFLETGMASVMPISTGPMPLDQSMRQAPALLHDAVVRALRILEIGGAIGAKTTHMN